MFSENRKAKGEGRAEVKGTESLGHRTEGSAETSLGRFCTFQVFGGCWPGPGDQIPLLPVHGSGNDRPEWMGPLMAQGLLSLPAPPGGLSAPSTMARAGGRQQGKSPPGHANNRQARTIIQIIGQKCLSSSHGDMRHSVLGWRSASTLKEVAG